MQPNNFLMTNTPCKKTKISLEQIQLFFFGRQNHHLIIIVNNKRSLGAQYQIYIILFLYLYLKLIFILPIIHIYISFIMFRVLGMTNKN